ncbi:MAG: PilT/PilU family type 4a pilus ATPase [Zetaproteobacteria bacterium]|nr:PilT/PilU family type 4a pilus ATPase [Zetaproteobacteria bacterium]
MVQLDIQSLLRVMVEREASDLYIASGLSPAYRIKSNVIPLDQAALTAAECQALAEACMNEKQRQQFEHDLEMNLALALPDIGRFRVNIFRQRGDAGLVIRKINTEVPNFDALGLPDVLRKIMMEKRGLVIMVGATGSGKSTSLAAMIDYRNASKTGHIITIEDPVEFIHPHKQCVITQREVGTDTLTYKDALKNTLRQAPDVILLGEIRDRETMEYGLEFAETGHLCMATLHANNANQALERVLNFFPEDTHPQVRMNLALNIRAIVSQRLVRTVDDGRAAAIEILINTPRISDLIDQWDITEIKATMAQGELYGMQTFDQNLIQLWKDGRIAKEEALAHADSTNDVRLQIKMEETKQAAVNKESPDETNIAAKENPNSSFTLSI